MITFVDLVLSQYPEASPEAVEMLARQRRDAMLAACDWTQTVDDPTGNAAAWAAYRQALRDLPADPNWPDVEFPEPPGGV